MFFVLLQEAIHLFNLGVIFFTIGLISLCAVVIYSFSYRRSQGSVRLKNQGLMNIAMGILFFSVAGLEYTTLTFQSSWAYILLGLIALLGFICIYYGYKRVKLSQAK